MERELVGFAFIFPGQGAQTVGMAAALAEDFASAREVADRIDTVLGQNLFALMRDGPGETLDLTANAQPALLMVSMMAMAALREATGISVDEAAFVAGHSCGEYAALTAAGALDIEDAARLLRLRGEAMQAAVAPARGAMAALLGADPPTARRAAEHGQRIGVCEIANDNCPGQMVVSGEAAAVRQAMDKARELGVRKVVLLPVSAPFHSSMMAPARAVMAEALAETDLGTPTPPIVSNDSARPETDPDRLRLALASQMTSMVRWRECVLWLAAEDGGAITHCIEAGHGATLTAINRRTTRSIHGLRLSEPADIGAVAGMVSGGAEL